MAPILQVKDLTKRYGGLTAVNEVSFDVEPNEILSVATARANQPSSS